MIETRTGLHHPRPQKKANRSLKKPWEDKKNANHGNKMGPMMDNTHYRMIYALNLKAENNSL